MAIVESDGLAGLSMRALAGKLGVAVTAIYWHVGNKEQLKDALVELIGPRIFDVKVRGRTPQDQVLSIARSLSRGLTLHTQLAGLAHERGRLFELFFPARSALAEAFTAAGLRGRRVADATNAVMQVVGDRATARVASAQWPSQRVDESLPWDEHPAIDPRTAKRLQRIPDDDETFEVALRALVRGLLAP